MCRFAERRELADFYRSQSQVGPKMLKPKMLTRAKIIQATNNQTIAPINDGGVPLDVENAEAHLPGEETLRH